MESGFGQNLEGFLIKGNLSLNPSVLPLYQGDGSIEASGTLYVNKIQEYNETMRKMNSNQRIIPPNVNKFSPAYAKIIAAKPKASVSANIRLGGIY